AGMREDPVADLLRQVEGFRDPERLLVVTKAASEPVLERGVEGLFSGVTEGRVPHVMAEADRLDQVLVQLQSPSDPACYGRGLERVGHARPVVVASGIDEDLRLALQAAKRLGVEDPVAVALEGRAKSAVVLVPQPAASLVRANGQR